MTTYISAVFHKDIRTVEFTAANGDKMLRTGGTLAWLLNNPGNLRPGGKYVSMIGQADTASGKFAIFSSVEEGRKEKRALLRRKYNDMTLYNAMHTYAPEGENDTAKYLAFVRKKSGATDQTVIKDMTDEQFNGMVAAMEQYEGFNANADTRKEKIVHATQVSLSDGAKPLPSFPVVAKTSTGKEKKLTTNAYGVLPAFITSKPGEMVQLFAEEAGKVGTKIGEFVLDQASASLLFARPLVTALAGSQPHNPDGGPRDAKRAPIRYVIQPKDTLGTVASKFKTSVDELVSNNRIRDRNKVFPGEVIWIYGPAPHDSTSGAAANDAAPAAAKNSYAIKRGDTLSGIADRHGVSVDQLMAANPAIKDRNKISPGQSINLPTGAKKAEPASTAVTKPKTGQPPASSKPSGPAPSLVKPPPVAPPKQPAVKPPAAVDTRPVRSAENQAHPIALVPYSQQRAPWIEHAYAQAKKWSGKKEGVITKTINFHEEIGYGKQFKTMAGGDNAWCASFVNYCMRKAGYPISSPHPYRARSFAADTTNYVQIDAPVFGAIALVKTSHVGFVYALDGSSPILLGGNQSDQINFVKYNPASLRYYVPKAYLAFANKELKDPKLDATHAKTLNDALGIVVVTKASGNER